MNHRERRTADQSATPDLTTAGPTASPAALYEAGVAHMRSGRQLEAQLCCEQALALDGDHVDTLHLLGCLALNARQYDHAVQWISRAIRREPRPAFLTSLGTMLLNQGRREDALQVFDKAVQLAPDDADLWRDLANALVALERTTDAVLSLQQALKLNPRHWDAANKAALLLFAAERFEEALSEFTRCDELQGDHFPTLYMRAMTLQKLKRFDAALADNERAYALDPSSADTCNNAGNVLRALGRNEEAIAWFDRSLALRPDFAATLGNKAVALGELRRIDGAFATYRRTLAIDPDHAVAAWNLAVLQLLTGDYKAGLAGREARWTIPSLAPDYPNFAQPMWLGGESIAGKTVLLFADEGRGDTIQFVRYVPLLAARGARVILAVQSLQKEPRGDDKLILRERSDIIELTSHLVDFAETAALMACLDLVITVDTSVAHLAGALGYPTWILLPYTPDYRWLLEDSPWYPTVRLFRQDESRSYARVLDKVRAALVAAVRSH